MNHSKIIPGLSGIISGGISVQDFSIMTSTNKSLSHEILENIISMGIGEKQNEEYLFKDGDRLRIAIELLKQGSYPDEISEYIDWRDFEGFVAQILSSLNFAVMNNLILTKPRMEIDVVGIRLGVALLIDCKHWKRYSNSALTRAVKKQVERTKHYVSNTRGSLAVPAIVTLYQDKIDFIDRVPIVPISQFSSFVDELYGNLDDIKTIETSQ